MIDRGEPSTDLQINSAAFTASEPGPGGLTSSSSLSIFRLIIYNLIHSLRGNPSRAALSRAPGCDRKLEKVLEELLRDADAH